MFLKELEDYPWFPTQLRKMQLEFVGWISVQLHLYRPILEIIRRFPSQTWVDLGSGSGWPAFYMQKNASPQIHYTLSDLYPDSVSDEVKKYVAVENRPLNLLEFQPEQGKQYSLFNAFHHFTSEQQRELIQKMKTARAGCIVAEVLEPSLLSFIQVTLAAFLVQPLTAWAIRPFSILRIITTYILPIQLITVAWDGWLSVLKSKSLQQYQELIEDLADSEYSIEVKRIPQLQGNLIVIIAQPISA
jgi:SAM-dependent methyltransferase